MGKHNREAAKQNFICSLLNGHVNGQLGTTCTNTLYYILFNWMSTWLKYINLNLGN